MATQVIWDLSILSLTGMKILLLQQFPHFASLNILLQMMTQVGKYLDSDSRAVDKDQQPRPLHYMRLLRWVTVMVTSSPSTTLQMDHLSHRPYRIGPDRTKAMDNLIQRWDRLSFNTCNLLIPSRKHGSNLLSLV